jgi:hypothetical protein
MDSSALQLLLAAVACVIIAWIVVFSIHKYNSNDEKHEKKDEYLDIARSALLTDKKFANIKEYNNKNNPSRDIIDVHASIGDSTFPHQMQIAHKRNWVSHESIDIV